MTERCDVLVVGAGPAGLAAATRLKQLGVSRVVVVERDTLAGGVPRLCRHSPFGMREFGRVLFGPAYAKALQSQAEKAGVEIRLATSVVEIARKGDLVVSLTSDGGLTQIAPQRMVLATGTREKTRAARFLTGDRPLGVVNTGALQNYAEKGLAPFRRPLILGSELVALSALLTCRGLGARAAMMAEERVRPLTRPAFMLLPRLLGVPVRCGAKVMDIHGGTRVEGVTLSVAGAGEIEVACDGVVVSGGFTPEASLARAAGLDIDPGTGGPAIDQFGRTSDPRIFAAGNVLHPVETAGWCWTEARRLADFLGLSLSGSLPDPGDAASVQPGAGIAYAVPQRLVRGGKGLGQFQMRVKDRVHGRLVTGSGKRGRHRAFFPERRILAPLPDVHGASISIWIED
jgi:NADPH-dependent 2,4-dienoyl-CoA reductase/sulfur reductase-like enzyme